MVVNLRGRHEAGWSAMLPVYAFVVVVGVLVVTGLVRWAGGDSPVAASAGFEADRSTDLSAVALALVVLRSFAGGGAALAGVDAIANGVPAMRRPKGRNAALTLVGVGVMTVLLFGGVLALAVVSGVTVARDACDLGGLPRPCEEYTQQTVLAQLAEAVFGAGSVGSVLVAVATVAVLLAAANSAFNGFPLLAATLADSGYLPRQLARRGDRLAHSNGILVLALGAVAVLLVLEARVGPLLDLYLVGLFTSFTLAQVGMARHWGQRLRAGRRAGRRGPLAGRALAVVAACLTGTVLLVLLVVKVPNGAWASVALMVRLGVAMQRIHRHYDVVAEEVALGEDEGPEPMPARVHAVVLVSRLHRPVTRALAYARATRPSTLEAVTVATDPDAARELGEEWAHRRVTVPLRVLDSPYREVTRPLVDARQGAAGPRPPRRRHRVPARVRRGPLVGGRPAQPVQPVAARPAVRHPRGHGRQRPVAARLGGGRRRPRRPRRRRAHPGPGGLRARAPPTATAARWREHGGAARRGRARGRRAAARTPSSCSPSPRARWPTAGTSWPGSTTPRTAGSSSSATPCRGSGSGSGSPTPARARASGGARPSRCSRPPRTGSSRRARTPTPAAAAAATSSTSSWPSSAGSRRPSSPSSSSGSGTSRRSRCSAARSRSRRCPSRAGRRGRRPGWAGGPGSPTPSTAPAGSASTPTAATPWSGSTAARR